MGCFDSVTHKCPYCGKLIEWQSKAGECSLKKYPLYSVPMEIAADLRGEIEKCSCGRKFMLGTDTPKKVTMFIAEYESYLGEEEDD